MNKYIEGMLIDLEIFNRKYVEALENSDESKKIYKCIIDDNGLAPDEIHTALLAKQAMFLRTIKNILLFFLWLTLIGIGLYILCGLYIISK